MIDWRMVRNLVGVAASMATLAALAAGILILRNDGEGYSRHLQKIDIVLMGNLDRRIAALEQGCTKKEQVADLYGSVFGSRYHVKTSP